MKTFKGFMPNQASNILMARQCNTGSKIQPFDSIFILTKKISCVYIYIICIVDTTNIDHIPELIQLDHAVFVFPENMCTRRNAESQK